MHQESHCLRQDARPATSDCRVQEIATLLALGYLRHRKRLARDTARESAAAAEKPLDDVTPRRKVKGRGDKASLEESRE